MKIILEGSKRLEFIEEIEIFYDGTSLYPYLMSQWRRFCQNLFPRIMKNVKKILIVSKNSEHTKQFQSAISENVFDYDLQIRNFTKSDPFFKYFKY